MKLCFITREVPPNLMGGIGTYVANITELLAESGHEVTLLTAWHPDAPTLGLDHPHTTESGIQIYYLPFVQGDWQLHPDLDCPEVIGLSALDISAVFAWVVADALESLIPRQGFDYIEAPEYEAPLSIFLSRRATRPLDHPAHSIPCVVHLHSPSHLIFENNDDDTSSSWIQHRRRYEMAAIRLADGVLAPSAYLAAQVGAELGMAKEEFKVIPYPVGQPLPEWDFDEARPKGFHCLYVGRVEPRKGVFEWVEAATSVARDFPDTYFHFVGGPHIRETREEGGRSTADIIQSFIPKPLQRQFIFHKQMPREELGRHYYKADLCVVPSRWDNYPNTCMEAMRCGKLVLASNQGGMAEMIEDNKSGILASCEYGDREDLKNALQDSLIEAIRLPEDARREKGKAARQRIEALCDNTTILDAHAEWRKTLKPATARAPSKSSKVNIAIFLTSTHQAEPTRKTLQSVADQAGIEVFPILVHNLETNTEALPEFAKGWAHLTGNPDAAHHPAGYSKDVFNQLISRFGRDEDFWCFLTPGMEIRPTFSQVCRQTLVNRTEDAFCMPWIYDKDENRIVPRSGVDEGELLLHPKNADFFGFFRQSDLRRILDESLNGYYLGDILRDLMLKLLQGGKFGTIVPEILGDSDQPTDPCCLSNFCLHHPADSHFQLFAAHKTKLDLNLFLHHHTGNVQDSKDSRVGKRRAAKGRPLDADSIGTNPGPLKKLSRLFAKFHST